MKYLLVGVAALLPMISLAHTRWFAEGEMPVYTAGPEAGLYLIVWAVIATAAVFIALFLHKQKWFDFEGMKPKKPHVFERAASTFVMVAGAFFLIAGTHEYLFSPNLTIESGVPMFLIVLQILVGLAFLLGIASRVCGILLGLMWVALFYYVDFVVAIENIWVLSIAIFITLMGNEYFSIISFSSLRSVMAPYKHYGLSFLRIGTGATLMILAFSEKILAPEYGINFLQIHDWNFMYKLGFEFSNYLFVISAGAVEFILGLIFVLGLITRLNALIVAVIFSIPLFILGPIELAGHMPHFAAVVLLLLFGGGGHFTFFADKRKYRK